MKPIYEMAVMNVRSLYPHAQDARLSSGNVRFRQTLRDTLWEDYCRMAPPDEKPSTTEMFDELWQHDWKPRFIPDLWWIDAESETIHVFEIEDTHPLTKEKLMLLHDWWWQMDSIDWKVIVTVFDRYGLAPRELNLTEFAFHVLPIIARETDAGT